MRSLSFYRDSLITYGPSESRGSCKKPICLLRDISGLSRKYFWASFPTMLTGLRME